MSAGYSKTPLIKKLGIKENFKVRFIQEPDHYADLLGPLPDGVRILEEDDFSELANFIHIFARNVSEFEEPFLIFKDQIERNGMIWVSWYKKAAKIPTDLNENIIRDFALSLGLVDVKVCAVDEQWSGLKIVIRKENR